MPCCSALPIAPCCQQGDYDALIGNALTQLNSPLYSVSAAMLQNDPWLFFPRYLLEHAEAANRHRDRGRLAPPAMGNATRAC